GRVQPELHASALEADARQAQRNRNVEVAGKVSRRFLGRSIEDLDRIFRGHFPEIETLLEDVRLVGERFYWNSHLVMNLAERALSRTAQDIEPGHRAVRDLDSRSVPACDLFEIG